MNLESAHLLPSKCRCDRCAGMVVHSHVGVTHLLDRNGMLDDGHCQNSLAWMRMQTAAVLLYFPIHDLFVLGMLVA